MKSEKQEKQKNRYWDLGYEEETKYIYLTSGRSAGKKAAQEREIQRQQEKADHKAKLEQEYGVVGHPKADKLYEIAWDYGHSAGFPEVEIYYNDLVVLLKEDE